MTTRIFIEPTRTCWIATFENSAVMPNGEPLPLPFHHSAEQTVVVADLKRRFPHAMVLVRTKAGWRHPVML